MDKSKLATAVYDKIANSYLKAFSAPSDHIDDFLALLPKNAKILDAGCGVGIDSGYMQSKGFNVIGVDLSEGMLKLARENFSTIDFKKQDLRKLNFAPESFDGIIASYSLIHIPKKDIPNVLKSFYTLLKQNGFIYIALHEGMSQEVFITEPFKPDEKLFLNIFSLNEIKELLTAQGFSIIKKFARKAQDKNEFRYTKLYIIAQK